MAHQLETELKRQLRARKSEWKAIADAVPEVSYSLISQLGNGKYKSSLTFRKLEPLMAYLRKNKPAQKRTAQ